MAGGAKRVQRQRAAGQRVVLVHDADVFAVVQTLVQKRLRLAALRARRQVGQYRREVTHRQVASLLVEQASGIARGQRHHTQGHPRGFFFKGFRQARDQFGGGRVGHGQHKAGVGLGGHKFVWNQRGLQLRQRFTHRRPDGARPRRGRHALAAALHQLVAQGFAQAPQRVAHGRLGQREVARSPRQAAFGHHLVKDAKQIEVQRAEIGGAHRRSRLEKLN